MNINRVCILGGTGFVGSTLVCKLAAMGIKTRLISRHPERHRELLVLPNVEIVEADITEFNRLSYYLHDVDAVINLVGILNDNTLDGSGFRKIHIDLPKLIVQACQKNNIKRLLQMSALHADAGTAPSHYLRSKGEGENHLHIFSDKGIQVTTFRPSVIFGPDDDFFNRFAKLLKVTPFICPIPRANSRFAPAYVGDVADAMIKHLLDPNSNGQRVDLCGPHSYSMLEIMEYTAAVLGIKRKFIALPDSLARFMAHMSDMANNIPIITPAMNMLIPGFKESRFSIDNYRSLLVDSTCDDAETLKTAIEDIVPKYLGNQNEQYHYDRFRSRSTGK
ncbi:MAG: complex I NDUFA9 subunit family protein [Gammaproteobacteria bacterium]|nr:complex I NDUFA9 subunit family protein [Gammaproteobacteria bacterium]